MHGSWTRIIEFKGNYIAVGLYLQITVIHMQIFYICIFYMEYIWIFFFQANCLFDKENWF